ncbi:MAG: flavodoxin [Peptococcaceae bacterium]
MLKKFILPGVLLVMVSFLTACAGNNDSAAPTPSGSGGILQEEAFDNPQPPKTFREVSGLSQSVEAEKKILIAYFSQARVVGEGADAISSATAYVGNTQNAAYEIHNIVDGDIFEIVTADTYPVDHQECSVIAERELKADARPALSTHIEDIASYDVVFLGYPIWWYTAPMAIRTFLEEYDFSGKTIVPFCTTLGAGVSGSINDLERLCPDSTIMEGLTLRAGQKDMSDDISEWLTKLGLYGK